MLTFADVEAAKYLLLLFIGESNRVAVEKGPGSYLPFCDVDPTIASVQLANVKMARPG